MQRPLNRKQVGRCALIRKQKKMPEEIVVIKQI